MASKKGWTLDEHPNRIVLVEGVTKKLDRQGTQRCLDHISVLAENGALVLAYKYHYEVPRYKNIDKMFWGSDTFVIVNGLEQQKTIVQHLAEQGVTVESVTSSRIPKNKFTLTPALLAILGNQTKKRPREEQEEDDEDEEDEDEEEENEERPAKRGRFDQDTHGSVSSQEASQEDDCFMYDDEEIPTPSQEVQSNYEHNMAAVKEYTRNYEAYKEEKKKHQRLALELQRSEKKLQEYLAIHNKWRIVKND